MSYVDAVRRPPALLIGLILIGVLSGCASRPAGEEAPPAASADVADVPMGDSAARERAQSWLNAAVLPPGAVASATMPFTVFGFANQFYAWPCTPVAELTAYWTVAGANVTDAANWLIAHPTADLVVPVQMPIPEGTDVDMASVGNVPDADAQEGIVYTVARMIDGVAIRAEIAALTESASCPSLTPGEQLGGVGQG